MAGIPKMTYLAVVLAVQADSARDTLSIERTTLTGSGIVEVGNLILTGRL